MLRGKKILIGITGSIAAYKSVFLIRLLIKAGAEVKVIMTEAAIEFVSPLTYSTISKNPVLYKLSDEGSWSNHVMLGRWADLMLIAPLSANTLSKMAIGACDNLLLAVYLSATCPVMAAPAMDEDMWKHPAVQQNLAKLADYGNKILPVYNGELASGLSGPGRMAEPEEILQAIEDFLSGNQDKLKGKKILISAGPTYEPIDPIRFIGNRSSGKMGIALAKTCAEHGGEVTLVLGPSAEIVPKNIKVINVQTAAEMYEQCNKTFLKADLGIMCAAVADYTLANPSDTKIKKQEEGLTLELSQTNDILRSLGHNKKQDQVLVGFALETNNEVDNAKQKLASKKADMIILNSLNDTGAGFGTDTNKITIFDAKGGQIAFEQKSKAEVARDIVKTIIEYANY